jgi:transcription termination factor NusA
VTEGFTSVEDIASVDDEELAGIEGFDESIAAELKRRAETFLAKRDGEMDESGGSWASRTRWPRSAASRRRSSWRSARRG